MERVQSLNKLFQEMLLLEKQQIFQKSKELTKKIVSILYMVAGFTFPDSNLRFVTGVFLK